MRQLLFSSLNQCCITKDYNDTLVQLRIHGFFRNQEYALPSFPFSPTNNLWIKDHVVKRIKTEHNCFRLRNSLLLAIPICKYVREQHPLEGSYISLLNVQHLSLLRAALLGWNNNYYESLKICLYQCLQGKSFTACYSNLH